MAPADDTPLYRVLTQSFFAPDTVEPGTVIGFTGTPGAHLEPLNDAARARMEDWYNEEVDELDPRTRDPTGRKLKPHAKFRFGGAQAPSVEPVMSVVSLPAPDAEENKIQTLAQMAAAKKATDQRPPPTPVPKATAPVHPKPKEE